MFISSHPQVKGSKSDQMIVSLSSNIIKLCSCLKHNHGFLTHLMLVQYIRPVYQYTVRPLSIVLSHPIPPPSHLSLLCCDPALWACFLFHLHQLPSHHICRCCSPTHNTLPSHLGLVNAFSFFRSKYSLCFLKKSFLGFSEDSW